MAYPTILFDSATGTDSNASGAGPTVAILSSSASTDSAGLVVTMPSANLSDVATDGSHAIYIQGEGIRSITATADSGLSTANVTVSTAFTGSLTSQSAAIGGVRQYLFGSTKSEIESSCEGGWTLSLAAGHAESYINVAEALVTFNVGDVRTNPVSIIGDESSRAEFVSVYNSFAYHFYFVGSSGLIIKNCNFQGYRGTTIAGSGNTRNLLSVGRGSTVENCNVTGRSFYNGQACFSDQAHSTFINCGAFITEDSPYIYNQYNGGGGFAGRSFTLIGCKAVGLYYGLACQAWEGYMPFVFNCHFDCAVGASYGGVGFYHVGNTLSSNVFKIQDGGYAISLSINAWPYWSSTKLFFNNNIFTSDGTYESLRVTDAATLETNLAPSTFLINNCFHNGLAPDTRLPSYRNIDSFDLDPQLSGDLRTGRFSVGNEAVASRINLIPSTGSNRPSQAGTQIYPFRHLVEDFFEVHEGTTVDGNLEQNFHPLGY
jgi:hypothetical protein